ncbi:hypothetical protein M0813_24422 [Anaeramoeba flamelloides]|uniref:Transmembrane protein n=1 Tax=Anaeramoeba flamelloides TaxID=1746091 RepID=A0ABQ8Y5I3_9EUKA|nr:hypothetical protein M0813_24422 [Anaeramoeba flamelloides]
MENQIDLELNNIAQMECEEYELQQPTKKKEESNETKGAENGNENENGNGNGNGNGNENDDDLNNHKQQTKPKSAIFFPEEREVEARRKKRKQLRSKFDGPTERQIFPCIAHEKKQKTAKIIMIIDCVFLGYLVLFTIISACLSHTDSSSSARRTWFNSCIYLIVFFIHNLYSFYNLNFEKRDHFKGKEDVTFCQYLMVQCYHAWKFIILVVLLFFVLLFYNIYLLVVVGQALGINRSDSFSKLTGPLLYFHYLLHIIILIIQVLFWIYFCFLSCKEEHF